MPSSPSGAEVSARRRAIDRYADLLRTGKEAAADLFADDAVYEDSHGLTTVGREAIRAVWREMLADVTPQWRFARVVEDGDECWAELERPTDGGWSLFATDHFTVADDGTITRLAYFQRPAAS